MDRFKLTVHAGIARLALTHPPVNTLDVPMMHELAVQMQALAAATTRPRVVVLASDVPGQFCHGIEPEAILGVGQTGRLQVFQALARLAESFVSSYIPVVVDISGPALGAGAVLAVFGDFAVIGQAAGKICFSDTRIGLPVPEFVQRLVQRKVNPSAWNDLLLLGRHVTADEAVRLGFANTAYDSDSERHEVLGDLVGSILRLSPAVLSETLRQSRQAERLALQRFKGDLANFADYLTDDYLGKGLRAMATGKTPEF